MIEFLIKFFKGMVIGISAMTAGAGTFGIVFGIYDRCMEIIAKPFKPFKENLKYILPILLGILLSFLLFGQGIIDFMKNYEVYFRCILLGLIIGGVPTLIKVANKNGFKKKYLISLVIAFLFTIVMTFVANNIKAGQTVESISTIALIVYGAIYSFGAVMPGMTTIHILEYMGVLPVIMAGIFAFNFEIIIPFGIGYVALALLTAKFITFLFKKFYGPTYYAIIGFSITSLALFIPKFSSIKEGIIGMFILLGSTCFMYGLTRLEKQIKEKEEKLLELDKEK